MKSDTVDLKTLFIKDVRYLVPLFQRRYVWNQNDHWKPLWEDVTSAVDSGNQDQDTRVPHFLGAVVLNQTSTRLREVETREVIDGQQRLITLQILIAACRDVANKKGFESQARLFRSLNFNNEDVIAGHQEENQFKIWPTNTDREAFKSVIKNQDKNIEQYKNSLLTRCYQFFSKQISQWLKEAEDPEQALKNLREVLRLQFHIVVIDLEPNDNPQVIFETLNARGSPLSASDLIKNLLFQLAINRGENVEFLYQEYWQSFEDPKWSKKVKQGGYSRFRLDLFLNHYLVMNTEKPVRPSALFDSFKEFMKKWPHSIERLLQDLQAYARIYDRFDSYPDNDPRGIFFYRLRTMNVATVEPFLLYVFGMEEDKKLEFSSLLNIVEMVESYLLRRLVQKLATKRYTDVFINILKKVKNDQNAVEDQVKNYLTGLEGHYRFWPDDDMFQSSLQSGNLYKILTQDRVRMILMALEQHLIKKNQFKEQVALPDQLTIEHLIPQKWDGPAWLLPDDDRHRLEKEQERNNRIHSLGNLTLLTRNLNSRVSNDSWEKKRTDILKHSALELNNNLPEVWNEEEIDKRGEYLSEIAVEIWPGTSHKIHESLDIEYDESELESILAEPVTAEDMESGRIRISFESSVLLPHDEQPVRIVMRGDEITAQWKPQINPGGEGHMTLDRLLLGKLVQVDETLNLVQGSDQQWFID